MRRNRWLRPFLVHFLCPASDGFPDYRIHVGDPTGTDGGQENNMGSFYRDDEGIALVMGTWENPHSRHELRCVSDEHVSEVSQS